MSSSNKEISESYSTYFILSSFYLMGVPEILELHAKEVSESYLLIYGCP